MPRLTEKDAYRLNYEADKVPPVIVSISDFKDKSNRTLTVGNMGYSARGRKTRHVYILDEKICVHNYTVIDGKVISSSHNRGVIELIEEVLPEHFSAPSATDLEFAELVLKMKRPLRFFRWGHHYDVSEPIDSIYFGYTLEGLPK